VHVVRARVAILEKLSTVPEATFDDADLHQLYQAYILLDPPGEPRQLPAAMNTVSGARRLPTYMAELDRRYEGSAGQCDTSPEPPP